MFVIHDVRGFHCNMILSCLVYGVMYLFKLHLYDVMLSTDLWSGYLGPVLVPSSPYLLNFAMKLKERMTDLVLYESAHEQICPSIE